MRLLDLFSGIGGFSLAAYWAWQDDLVILAFAENDEYCQKILQKNFPNVPIYNDIRDIKGNEFDAVELVTGGFPCQPFSVAGKQKGEKDNRFLWPEMLRVCEAFKPEFIVAENVYGIITMDNGRIFETICADLENLKYEVTTFIIPACAVGAWHVRNRAWIIAHTNSEGKSRRTKYGKKKGGMVPDTDKARLQNGQLGGSKISGSDSERENAADNFTAFAIDGKNDTDANSERLKKQRWPIAKRKEYTKPKFGDWWEFEPELGRMANGIPNRVDRLKSLGNAIVPQVAYEIFTIIKNYKAES